MEKTGSSEAEAPLMTSRETLSKAQEAHDPESRKTQNDPYKKRTEEPLYEPPDGGWGWCVVFANTICMMVMATQGPCFGIFYGERLRELGASPMLAAWLFNFQSLIWNLAGPWAGVLSEKFTYRLVAMVSSFAAASSLILSAMVTNPYLLLFTFSIFSGIGGGICINCCFHMTAKYFKKRLGLANGIMVTGGSLGLILMPQMASYLQQIYPFEWATIIAGAVMMNAVVATSLFHPVEWHAKKSTAHIKVADSIPIDKTESAESTETFESGITSSTASKITTGVFQRCASAPQHLLILDAEKIQSVTKSVVWRKRRVSESPYSLGSDINDLGTRGLDATEGEEKWSFFQFGSCTLSGSGLTIQPPQQQLSYKPQADNNDDAKSDDANQGIWRKFLSHYQPSVLRDPLVISVALSTCVTITSALNILSTMPFVLNDAGYSLQSAASAISVTAIADLVTRMVCALTTDISWVKPRLLYAFAQVISIVAPIVLINSWHNWTVVLLCMSAMGIGLGILYVLDVFLIVRVLGVEKLQSVFGMSQLLRVISFSSLGPIGGVLRDATGTYASALIFYTCNIFLGFLIMTSTVFYTRRRSRSRMQSQDPRP